MARSRRGLVPGRVGRSPRRKSSWDLGPGGTADTEFTASGSAIVASGAVSLLDGTTIVRIRGEILAYLTSANAAGNGFRVGVGVLLTEADAFSIGITAIPTPLADMDHEDWVWHNVIGLRASAPINTGAIASEDVGGMNASSIRIEVDTHAMRKFDADKLLVIVAEVVEVGTAVMRVGGETRMLGLLS